MKVLLPTDFSDNSFRAICYAIELLGSGHTWTLLHTYHTPHAGAGMLVKIDDILAKESAQEMAAFESRVKHALVDQADSISARSEHGDIVQVADILAKEEGHELIAMGTTGASGLKEALFGSIASKVIEQAKLPVIAIPAMAKFSGLSKVAVADDEDPVKNLNVQIPLDLIRSHESQVFMVNVTRGEDKVYMAGSPIDQLFSSVDRSHHTIHNKDVSEGLHAFIKEESIEMIVMVHRKESEFIEWLTVSTSEEMAMHVRIPLLVIKD